MIYVTHCGPVTLYGNISAFFGACYGCHYVNHIKFNVIETTWEKRFNNTAYSQYNHYY